MTQYSQLEDAEINERLKTLPDWKKVGKELVLKKGFGDYAVALEFVYEVGKASQREDHHPEISLSYSEVVVKYSTHKVGGISILDFEMAQLVSELVTKFERQMESSKS